MKQFLVLIVALLVATSALGQDLLVKRNGEQMRVKVLKITKKSVQFVRHGTELPVYTLPVTDIAYIEYPLGDRDTFDKEEKTASAPAPAPKAEVEDSTSKAERVHGPVQPLVERQAIEYKTYTIGEIYDKDGIKGVVALLYDDGQHGVIMSLDEACLAWSSLHRKKVKNMGATSKTDGLENMAAIEKYIAENGLSWCDFPAFEWCRNKGEGWYLPSINEVWSAGTIYMGGSRRVSKIKFRKAYNDAIQAAGGTPLSNIMFYHSSTEDSDAKYSLYSHFNSDPPYTQSGYKADDLFVRAFHKF